MTPLDYARGRRVEWRRPLRRALVVIAAVAVAVTIVVASRVLWTLLERRRSERAVAAWYVLVRGTTLPADALIYSERPEDASRRGADVHRFARPGDPLAIDWIGFDGAYPTLRLVGFDASRVPLLVADHVIYAREHPAATPVTRGPSFVIAYFCPHDSGEAPEFEIEVTPPVTANGVAPKVSYAYGHLRVDAPAELFNHLRLFAGQPDAHDPTRFSIPFDSDGGSGRFAFQLPADASLPTVRVEWNAAVPVERDVVFGGADGATIRGTLCLPSGAAPDGKHAALVLIAGSGPTDRDGNQRPAIVTDLLRRLAVALARDGVVTLRFDKRGMHANAAELPANAADYDAFFTWEHFVDDVAAAHAFVSRQPEVDASRVGLLGHSEGGLLALAAVARLPRPPAMLVLIGTPGRPVDEVLDDQLNAVLARQPAAIAALCRGTHHLVVGQIRRTGVVPTTLPFGLSDLYPSYLGRFLQSELALDPCALAAAYDGPALVIAGELDAQTSPDRDAKALDAAFAARPAGRHALVVAGGASHHLKAVATPYAPGLVGDVAPDAIEAIDRWIADNHFAPTIAPADGG